MSKEISYAAINVPRSIVFSIVINGFLGFGMLLAVIFCLGDPLAALDAQTTIGYPFIEVFVSATQSPGGATAMTAIVIALAISFTIGSMATASRIIWSFARDRGLPFSSVLYHAGAQDLLRYVYEYADNILGSHHAPQSLRMPLSSPPPSPAYLP